MYQAVNWYFPDQGESFKPSGHYNICKHLQTSANICTGNYVNGS
jgi:hypothetical protein